MAIVEKQAETEIVELAGDELLAYFDKEARRRLGMSGEEFRRRLHAGEFDDICDDPFDHPDITHLTILESFLR
jgi:hypothetical protein